MRYYYKRYRATLTYGPGETYIGQSGAHIKIAAHGGYYYSTVRRRIDSATGYYLFYNSPMAATATDGWPNYVISNAYTAIYYQMVYPYYNGFNARQIGIYTLDRTYTKTSLVDELIAEDGTYPDDGWDEATGYYYVKDRVAQSLMPIVGGVARTCDTYAMVGGVWTKVTQIAPRIDGAWKNMG